MQRQIRVMVGHRIKSEQKHHMSDHKENGHPKCPTNEQNYVHTRMYVL